MYTARTRLCKCSCTRALYTAAYTAHHVHGRCAYRAVYTFPDGTLRPCAACYGRVHGPFTARSRQCIRPCTTAVTAVRHVHTSTPQLKGRVRAMYTSVYTASTQSCTWQVGLYGHVHGPRRHVTAVGRVHGRNAPCTRSCTRPIHSRVHVRLHGPCTPPRTRPVVYIAGRPTGPCARSQTARYGRVRPVIRGPFTAVYTSVYDGRHGRPIRAYVYTAVKRPCTRHVHVPLHGQYTVVYMAGGPTRPCTRAETARYGRGPCTRP